VCELAEDFLQTRRDRSARQITSHGAAHPIRNAIDPSIRDLQTGILVVLSLLAAIGQFHGLETIQFHRFSHR
jgi:hypothetical protein